MSQSPATSAANLIERLQRELRQLLDVAGKLSAEVALLAEGVNDHRDRTLRYEYQGKSYTIRELARQCGMKYQTLYFRLRNAGMSVEDAVTAPLGQARPRAVKTERASKTTKSKNVQHPFKGEMLTVAEISERTGMTRATIYGRMMRGCTAEEAATGVKMQRERTPLARTSVVEAAPKPAAAVVITAQPVTLAKEVEATTPDNAKRTVAKTPKGRFEPDVVVPTFGALKPGQYADGGSAWARAVLGGNR